MIQFNLLPDIKIQLIRAKRINRLVMLASLSSAAVALTIMILLYSFVNFAQKKHINDVNKDIAKYDKQLRSVQELNKVLTIQNQLNTLTSLHDLKPDTNRLFGYLTAITPNQVSISKVQIDFGTNTLSISGGADSLSTVNKFVDTIKFTSFNLKDQTSQTKSFSSTVLTGFTRSEKQSNYSIETKFDPKIFDSKTLLDMVVPKIISTRSETEKPAALFQSTETKVK